MKKEHPLEQGQYTPTQVLYLRQHSCASVHPLQHSGNFDQTEKNEGRGEEKKKKKKR
jgi:hypothetical protein